MATRYFSVKNWTKFQHYKDRDPPWIKFHVALLDDYEFTCLQDASKAHLLAIWLLASRYQNRIPLDAEWVGKAIKANSPVDLGALLAAGFILDVSEPEGKTPTESTVSQDASALLAECSESAPSEDREQRTESKKVVQNTSCSSPRATDATSARARGTRIPDDWTLSEALREWSTAEANEARAPPDIVDRQAARFRDYWRGRSGQDARKVDWDATWRNWLRRAMEGTHGHRGSGNGKSGSYLAGVAEFARTAGD